MAIFRNNVTSEEVREFWSLVEECKEKSFCESRQVTNYIIKNRLGDKYKHIAGDLYLRRGFDSWKYQGGISPEYYGKLCHELNLNNKCSEVRVEKFESYAMQNIFS